MKKRALSTTTAGMVASLALVAAAAVPAQGVETEESTADLIQRVAPDQGAVSSPVTSGSGFATDISQIPSSASEPVSVLGDEGVSLDVLPPKELSLGTGEVAEDGTVVYESADGGTDFAVQSLDSGAIRMQTVINSADDPLEYSYELGNGFKPVEAADGTLVAYRFNDAGEFEAFVLGDAWARDANGEAVETRYELQGDAVVQVVEADADSAFPIVADPTWTWYAAAYGAGFSKAETKTLSSAGAVTGFCGLLPGGLALACGVAGAQWFAQAGLAANANECVFIAAVPAPLAVRWESDQCA